MEFEKIELPFKLKRPILSLGAQTKNTVCFAKDSFAYISPIHPDLNNFQDFLDFEKTVKYFLKKNPQIIAYDLHPEYQSTKYACDLRSSVCRLQPAQHHHAHIASCMAENGLRDKKIIGVAFDGTGLSLDNKIWGAEVLICDYKNSRRAAHLREIPLLGGEKAILEPWRISAAWLYLIYKERFLNLRIDFVKALDKGKWRIIKNMYLRDFNSPLASSMGRLFDAIACLVLNRYKASFEAELAMELERIAAEDTRQGTGYRVGINRKDGIYIIDPTSLFKQIVSDLMHKEPKEKIAYRFHLTLAEMVRKICLILRKETSINKVALSGGVFQNKLLLSLSQEALDKNGFEVFTHKDLSCNDSSISLGQAVIANFRC